MTQIRFYGDSPPGFAEAVLPGRLIVLEGTDGVGRSTQIALLQEWLEGRGFAVASTGLRRSDLASKGIDRAKQGHTFSESVLFLFYVTDLADRLEKQILPALRAGMVVLTDRYIYSMIARAVVRGVDPQWIRDVFGYALIPDAIFYLEVNVPSLIPRLLNDRGFDYWESGMDFLPYNDYYESYMDYQGRLLAQFAQMADEFHFRRVDATKRIPSVFKALKGEIKDLLKDMKPPEVVKAAKEKEKSKGR
jgi:dTMP kinase